MKWRRKVERGDQHDGRKDRVTDEKVARHTLAIPMNPMKHDAAAVAKYAQRRVQTIRTESTAQASVEPSHSLSLSQPSERERARRRSANARLHSAPTSEPARERVLESDMELGEQRLRWKRAR